VEPLTIVLFILGIGLLLLGADTLVKGAVDLAVSVGISPLVVGLTVVAFGTSAPEAAVSVQSTMTGGGDIALGNVIGSNILNILLILGLSALVAPLLVSRQLLRFDLPVMIGVSFLPLLFGLNGAIGRGEGLVLFLGVVAYTGYLVRKSRRERIEGLARIATQEVPEAPRRGIPANVGLVLLGMGMLVLGSRWLVAGAVEMATLLGVNELVIGLTVVAAGTSLPEVATSVLASLKGERDIAVGNVVGSNIFNILLVMGLAGMAGPDGIPVIPAALTFDLPVMIAVAMACFPIFFTGYIISRWEGALFVGYYVAYTSFLVLDASGHDALPIFTEAMVFFVLPLTAISLVMLAWNELRQDRGSEVPG
jgi:cation:H+ antiporter